MNNTGSINKGIENSWSLIGFARAFGKMQVGHFKDSEGKPFSSCIFTHPETNNRVFVGFSSKMGELTPSQIASQVSDLQVVKLQDGGFILCKVGSGTWEDVDLGF